MPHKHADLSLSPRTHIGNHVVAHVCNPSVSTAIQVWRQTPQKLTSLLTAEAAAVAAGKPPVEASARPPHPSFEIGPGREACWVIRGYGYLPPQSKSWDLGASLRDIQRI